MKWKSTPRLFKRIPTLPTLMVKPTIWDKWCDGACAYWEPTQLAEDFHPGVALVVCYSPYQDLPQDSLREKKTISLSVVYIPEHWILPSFGEAAYVVNHAWDAKDPLGMMSLAQIHKKSPFYLDISYREYKQHLTNCCQQGTDWGCVDTQRILLSAPSTRDRTPSVRVGR